MTDIRQTKDYAKYLESSGWKILKIKGCYIFLKKFPLLGWFIKIQRPDKISRYKDILDLENKYHPFQFSIEPLDIKNLDLISNFKFKISNSPSLPTKTLQIDLTKSREQLLKEMSAKTRYNTRLATKKNIEIKISKDIKKFAGLKGNFLSQKNNILKLYKAFGKNAHLFLAHKDSQLLAGILLLTTKDTAYYMHAAATQEGKKLFAPTLLTWHTIQFAKKLGLKIYDFDGIYDERFPIKSWLGFTKFKKGFGGYEVEYPGCFVKTKFLRNKLFE